MREWRKATWALVGWTVLSLLWAATAARGDFSCTGETGVARAVCDAGATIGLSLGVTFVVIVWLIGFVILGVIWLMNRPKSVPR